jgi:hypothetical protein
LTTNKGQDAGESLSTDAYPKIVMLNLFHRW